VYKNGTSFMPVAMGTGERAIFQKWCGMPMVGFSCTYPGRALETNNEHIRVEDYREHVKFMATLMCEIADLRDVPAA
jgi:hypothetical protein